jgi:hypothetical protein
MTFRKELCLYLRLDTGTYRFVELFNGLSCCRGMFSVHCFVFLKLSNRVFNIM